MPPKKDVLAPETFIAGYDNKETRLLAAAFVSSIGPDKYDYPLFAKLSGFTEGTLKKFWPPVKKKVIEEHPNFGKFIAGSAVAAAHTPKATAGKKRKAADADADADAGADADTETKSCSADAIDSKNAETKVKKSPVKGKRGKKAKEEENSAGDGDELDDA